MIDKYGWMLDEHLSVTLKVSTVLLSFADLTCLDITNDELIDLQNQLHDLIIGVLVRHPELHYFQGYHDIASVFMLVLGPELALPCLERATVLRLRGNLDPGWAKKNFFFSFINDLNLDSMLRTFKPFSQSLLMVKAILKRSDPDLFKAIKPIPVDFGLAPILTLFSHSTEHLPTISRLFDFFLASHPGMPVYTLAAALSLNKDKFKNSNFDEGTLFMMLSKAGELVDVDETILRAQQIMDRAPPERLREWRRLGRYSSYKTGYEPHTTTLECDELLIKQAFELEKQLRREQNGNVNHIWFGGASLVAIGSIFIYIYWRSH